MTNQIETLKNVVASHFAGKVKTGEELRDVINQLAATELFNVTAEECEMVARHNEATQGIKMF